MTYIVHFNDGVKDQYETATSFDDAETRVAELQATGRPAIILEDFTRE